MTGTRHSQTSPNNAPRSFSAGTNVAEYLTFESLVAFVTLTALEIVLGIDNIIFIAIQAGRLPEHQREKGRRFGLLLAVVSRICLLLGIS